VICRVGGGGVPFAFFHIIWVPWLYQNRFFDLLRTWLWDLTMVMRPNRWTDSNGRIGRVNRFHPWEFWSSLILPYKMT
jgi:hypothetical protein